MGADRHGVVIGMMSLFIACISFTEVSGVTPTNASKCLIQHYQVATCNSDAPNLRREQFSCSPHFTIDQLVTPLGGFALMLLLLSLTVWSQKHYVYFWKGAALGTYFQVEWTFFRTPEDMLIISRGTKIETNFNDRGDGTRIYRVIRLINNGKQVFMVDVHTDGHGGVGVLAKVVGILVMAYFNLQ